MTTIYQSSGNSGCVLSTRVDDESYKSIYHLMSIGGYNDISSFVRDSIFVRCKEISYGMVGYMDDKVIDNNRKSFTHTNYITKKR